MKSKRSAKTKTLTPAKRGFGRSSRAVADGREATFREIVGMIQAARGRPLQAVNTELVELYWQVGGFISGKIETAAWGEGVVDELARFIAWGIPTSRDLPAAACFGRASFSTPTGASQLSQHC